MQLSARSNALVIVLCVCSRTEQSGDLSVDLTFEMVRAMIAEREEQRVSTASGALPHPTSQPRSTRPYTYMCLIDACACACVRIQMNALAIWSRIVTQARRRQVSGPRRRCSP
jgi:hypothetical protein